MGEGSSIRPESVFSLMMDEDSTLNHRDQLLGSLAVVELRKARSANWLYFRYRSMLKQGNEKLVVKFASIARFLEILIRTESRVSLSFAEAGSKISLKITSQTPPERFPQKILGVAVSQLGDKLDRFIEYKVKNATNPVLDEGQTDEVEEDLEKNLENEKPFDK